MNIYLAIVLLAFAGVMRELIALASKIVDLAFKLVDRR